MFQINDDYSIYITRGDVAFFGVTATDNSGEKHIFHNGDIVRIKVFAKKDCTAVAFQKDFAVTEETEKVYILLTEEETKIGGVISKPVDYWYEIELNPYTNPQTIIGYDDDGAKIFKLFPEGRDLVSPMTTEDIPVVDSELSLTSDRPIQNQAVAKAIIGMEDKVNAMSNELDTAIKNTAEAAAKAAAVAAAESAREEMERVAGEVCESVGEQMEQKAADTLETIPDDYTALSNEVNQLSEEVDEIRLHTKNIFEGEFEQGNISSVTGADDDNLANYYVRTNTYIPVDTSIVQEDNQCYIMLSYISYMDKMRVAFYDENKAFISMSSGATSLERLYNRKDKFFVVPSNAHYIRFAICGSNGTNQYTPSDISEPQIEYGYIFTDYVKPYTANDMTARKGVSELKTETEELKTVLENNLENTVNIFGGELEQGNINYSTGENTDSTAAYYVRCKNHISVNEEAKYTLSFISPMNAISIYFYTADKVFISGSERMVMGIEGRAYTRKRVFSVTTPENCAFIRFKMYGSNGTVTYTLDEVTEMQVVEGGGIPDYIPANTNVDYTVRSKIDFPVQYACGRILCIGDSLTEGYYAHRGTIEGTIINENYPYYLGRMLNAEVTNTGGSGGAPSTWLAAHPDYDFTPFDTVIIWLGTNGGLSVDDIAVSGTETNAYNALIQTVKSANATCKIMLATVFATGELRTGVTPYSVQATNEAVRMLANLHNADVVDMSGMGFEMHPELHSETDTTHFTKAGNIYVASRFVKHMKDTFDVANVEFGLSVAR